MPIMNGYAFLSRIKADDACSLIPVVVTTQSSSEEDEVEALAHGATDFVSKPYRPGNHPTPDRRPDSFAETAAIVNQLRYDQLTGAYSKEYFYQQVKDTFVEAPEKEYDIVCLNVENFKLVNDVFGTQAGDCLLKGIVKICKEFAGGKGICGRIGAGSICLHDRARLQLYERFICEYHLQD